MQTRSNIDDIEYPQTIDTLVHLGAGRCSELEAHLALDPRQLLLVEADPKLANALQARTADIPQVRVSCAAVAGHSGHSTFYRYNLLDAGSLHTASGILKLFPGLKTAEEFQVEKVNPVTLLRSLHLEVQEENLLIVELPGEELPVLQALQEAQQLHLFCQIQLYCGREPLYEDGAPAALILQWLQQQGFDLLKEDDSHDPDCPCWTLQRNPLHLRNTDLREQVEQLVKAKDEQTKLATERQQKIEQLTKAKDEQTKLATERQQKIEQLTKAKDEQAKLAIEQTAIIERLTWERDEQDQRQRLLDEELLKAESQIELISSILIREKAF